MTTPLIQVIRDLLRDFQAGAISEEALRIQLDNTATTTLLRSMAGQALALTEDESQLAVPGIPGDVIATSDFIHSKGIAIGRNAIALSDVTINLYIVVPPTEGDTAPQEPTISLPPPTDLADTSTQPPRRIPHLAYRAEMLIGRAVCRPPLP